MEILVVNCNTSEAMTAEIGVAARAVASPGTVVTAVNPTWGVSSAEGYYDSFISAAAVLELLTEWPGTPDAVVLAGFGEHGREGARQLMDMPVVDITEAAAWAAMLIGHRYGVVTTTATSVEQIRASLMLAGVADRCAGIVASGIRVLDLALDTAAVVERLVADGRRLLSSGADALILGCAGMTEVRAEVSDRLGVPVVDGVSAAVAAAESLVRMRLRTSKAGPYATPDVEKLRPGWASSRPVAREGVS